MGGSNGSRQQDGSLLMPGLPRAMQSLLSSRNLPSQLASLLYMPRTRPEALSTSQHQSRATRAAAYFLGWFLPPVSEQQPAKPPSCSLTSETGTHTPQASQTPGTNCKGLPWGRREDHCTANPRSAPRHEPPSTRIPLPHFTQGPEHQLPLTHGLMPLGCHTYSALTTLPCTHTVEAVPWFHPAIYPQAN